MAVICSSGSIERKKKVNSRSVLESTDSATGFKQVSDGQTKTKNDTKFVDLSKKGNSENRKKPVSVDPLMDMEVHAILKEHTSKDGKLKVR